MGLLYTLCVITPLLAACTVASLRRFWRARGMLPQLGLDSELSGIPCVSKFLPERMRCGARVIYSGVQYVVRDVYVFTVDDAPWYFYALHSNEGGILRNDALSVHIDNGELHVCWWNRGDTRQRAEELAITIDGAKYTACTEGASDYRAEGELTHGRRGAVAYKLFNNDMRQRWLFFANWDGSDHDTEELFVGTRVSANDVTILPPEKSDWHGEGFDAEMGWAVLTAITGVGTILSGAKAVVLAVGLF